jgi:hypothetical protein
VADVDARHGGEHVVLRCLADTSGVLKRGDRSVVEEAMERFSEKFPQLFMAVYTGSLGEIGNLRQFGFWLLNRAAFEDLPAEKPNEGGILLTLDPESKSAGFVFGYLLDAFLDESDTFECLSRAHAYWLEGRYAAGMVKAIQHLEGILERRCRQARRDPDLFQAKVVPKAKMVDSVRRIRAGHRTEGEAKQQMEVEP